MSKTIYFRVDGDEGLKAGLGHIYRTLKIYFFLKKKFKDKLNYVFLSRYKLGIQILKSKTKERVIRFNKKNLKACGITKEDYILIDTLGIEGFFLNFLNKIRCNNKISFDELNNKFTTGLIINGIFFAKKKIKKKKKLKVYQGLKYIIINENFIVKKKNLKNYKNCLVTCGGSDKNSFLYKLGKKLVNYKFNKIYLIVGKGVKTNNRVLSLNNKKIHLVKNSENLKKYFDKCQLAIVSGGTVMFEAISSGLLTYVIKNYEHQKYAINFFKKNKNINYLGSLSSINNSKIFSKKIENFFNNKELYNSMFIKNIKTIDGKGIKRVIKIIWKFIKIKN